MNITSTDTAEQIAEKLKSIVNKRVAEESAARDEKTSDLEQRYMQLKEGLDAISERLKSNAHHGASYVEGADDAFKTDNPDKQFNLHRGLVGWHTDFNYDKTPYGDLAGEKSLWPERDILMEATKKAQSADVDIEGGFAVPEQFMADFIPILLARSIAAQLGVRFETGFSGSPVVWPKITRAAQAYWVGENTAPTETDIELGQVSMEPHDLAALVPMSNRLLRMSAGGFEAMLRNHLARIMALKLDLAVFKGTGASGEPLGIQNVPSVPTLDWDTVPAAAEKGDASTIQNITDKLSIMMETVDTSNALEGELGWAAHPQVLGYFREVKDTDGHPLFKFGDPNETGERQLYGYRLLTSTQLANGDPADFIFGNWADAMVGQWGTMVLDSSMHAGNAFFKRQTYIRAHLAADVGVMHEESFVQATNFDATA